jgi:hypothetical protein
MERLPDNRLHNHLTPADPLPHNVGLLRKRSSRKIMNRRGDGTRLEPIVVRRARRPDRSLILPILREHLHASGALDEHGEHGRRLDRRRRASWP